MPLYEYNCKKCQAKFEKLVKSMSASSGGASSESTATAEAIACPECGSTKITRSISVFAAVGKDAATARAPSPGGCGRCGGPGPCAFDD
jgi:DNA-directed RNA polymerase subunit RPC12/RpoP